MRRNPNNIIAYQRDQHLEDEATINTLTEEIKDLSKKLARAERTKEDLRTERDKYKARAEMHDVVKQLKKKERDYNMLLLEK